MVESLAVSNLAVTDLFVGDSEASSESTVPMKQRTLSTAIREARVRAGMNPDEVCPYDFPRGS
jgi:hypothetical protein